MAFALALSLDDRGASLELWRIDPRNEPPLEARDEAIFEGRYFAGGAVGAEYNLLLGVV